MTKGYGLTKNKLYHISTGTAQGSVSSRPGRRTCGKRRRIVRLLLRGLFRRLTGGVYRLVTILRRCEGDTVRAEGRFCGGGVMALGCCSFLVWRFVGGVFCVALCCGCRERKDHTPSKTPMINTPNTTTYRGRVRGADGVCVVGVSWIGCEEVTRAGGSSSLSSSCGVFLSSLSNWTRGE